MAASILSIVVGRTIEGVLSARETVATETPATRAMSLIFAITVIVTVAADRAQVIHSGHLQPYRMVTFPLRKDRLESPWKRAVATDRDRLRPLSW